MAKHEHMSTDRALTHAALVGHTLRGAVLEGKSFAEALAAAQGAVGEDSRFFNRQQVSDPGGPMMDEAYYPR
jgi:hypothetical protein